MLTQYSKVATVGELEDGEMMLVLAEDQDILLARINGEYFAIDNWCSHTAGMLDQGVLVDYEVECPLHEGRFDLRTGQVTNPPADEPVASFAVRVEGDDILVGPK